MLLFYTPWKHKKTGFRHFEGEYCEKGTLTWKWLYSKLFFIPWKITLTWNLALRFEGEVRQKFHPCLFLQIFVNFLEKQPSTKSCPDVIILQEVMKLRNVRNVSPVFGGSFLCIFSLILRLKKSQSFVSFFIIFTKFWMIRCCLDASYIIYANVHT